MENNKMNTKILGDKKPRRYNEGLFELVNKRFAQDHIQLWSENSYHH